jgi:L-methionine (R)-S-oxide reductase
MNPTEQQLAELQALASSPAPREERARSAARLIRALGAYRWIGLYDVSDAEIAVIAWDGPEPPTFPQFPVTQGLNGAAVATKRPVIAQDVTKDARYLTTIGGTRGEMIQPVLTRDGVVVGTIDVESDRIDAFTSRDDVLLAACATALAALWDRQ